MSHYGGMVTVHHVCQFSSRPTLTWINVFKPSSSYPEGLPERWVSLMSKRSSLKRENKFLAVLYPVALSPYMTLTFMAASASFLPLSNLKRRICRKCSNFSTCHSISSVHGSTHYLQNDKISICKLKHNNWTSNKKWQSITEPIGTNYRNTNTRNKISMEICSKLIVHRCGTGGSMHACHAAGPGSIPGRDKFPGWVFSGFFLTCKKNVRKL